MRRVILPLVALLLAGTATFGVRAWLERPEPAVAAPAPEQRKGVLVAAADLEIGSFVQPDSMRWQDWPDVSVPETYLIRGQLKAAFRPIPL
jgi:Flp pilus assembly protein CpaB